MRWRLSCSGAVLAAVLATAAAAQQQPPAPPPGGASAAATADRPATPPEAAPGAPADPATSTPTDPAAGSPAPAGVAAQPAPVGIAAEPAPAPTAATATSAEAPAPAAGHGATPPAAFDPTLLYVFMLATFIGLGVITRVSRLLHTPLMSLTNAISAIAVVGSIVIAGEENPFYITVLGAIALFASMTNIVSGFLITDRMLKMFKKREVEK